MQAQGLAPLPLLSADTTVILAGAVLKARRPRRCRTHPARALSGATHEVRTAVALWAGDGLREAVSVTQVSMRALDAEDIARYCDSGEPYGKAGAYGVRDWPAPSSPACRAAIPA